MTEQDFNKLLHRFENGLCTPEEQRRIEQWLDNMKDEGNAFRSQAERQGVMKDLLASIHEKAGINRSNNRTMIASTWMKVAATVLMLIIGSYALIEFEFANLGRQGIAIEAETQNEIQKILLPDGSIVWLKAESKLYYPETFTSKERVVTLAGEALFEVAKDPSHPFVIHTGDLTTRVLGTSFNIRSTIQHTEVFVLTGKVSVSLKKGNQKIDLLPNEKILYSHASNQLLKEIDVVGTRNVAAYTKGTEYDMTFQDARVHEIASHIEGKFRVKVTVEGDIQSCVLTADLTDQSLLNTLDIISEALNATYEIRGDEVTLKGDGCN